MSSAILVSLQKRPGRISHRCGVLGHVINAAETSATAREDRGFAVSARKALKYSWFADRNDYAERVEG
jgi:hypothetical protein